MTSSTESLAILARWSLNFRLMMVAVASLAMTFEGDPAPLLPLALVAAMGVNLVPLLWWRRFGPWVARHPLVLLVDLVLTTGLLLLTGTDGPLLFYTLGTAFLGGVLYGSAGGVGYSVMVVLGYLFAGALRGPMADQEAGFQEVVAMPALLVVVAVGGAAIRRLLLERDMAQQQALQQRTDAAINEDRARLARELHDSVAKTLHGIALQAAGLERHVRTDVERAAREAAVIGRTCARAATESRELLTSLRSHRIDLPLDQAVSTMARKWADRSGTELHGAIEPVPVVDPGIRHELLRIVDEALTNIERHADASHVEVSLCSDGGAVVLRVADDGVGLAHAPDLARLAGDGHYGLQGIVERAARVHGEAVVTTGDGEGMAIEVKVPAEVVDDTVELARRQRGRQSG